MISKRLKYLLVILCLMFLLTTEISALDCYYKKTRFGKVIEAQFRINENNNKLVYSGVVGDFESEDHSHIDGESQGVENWDKFFSPLDQNITINFKGEDYYSQNKACPPIAILVDRSGQFDLVVSDQAHYKEFENYALQKQGYAVMTLTIPNNDTLIRYPSSCLGLNENSCKNNENFACIWVENEDATGNQGGYCNVDNLLYVSCGGASDIPMEIPSLISLLVNLLKIATPIILIFISIITLLKAMSAGKEDEIKKATSSLVKKIIAAAMVFFVIGIVQFVVSKVAEADEYQGFTECLDCFLNNSCEETTYYKTVVAGEDMCTRLTTGNTESCKDMK